MISAVGIVGNVEDLGLEDTRVQVERTHVVIDHYCRTAEPGLYAIGDLAGAPLACPQGQPRGRAVRGGDRRTRRAPDRLDQHPGLHLLPAAGGQRRLDRGEGEARGQGAIRVGRFPFIGNGKAIAMGEPEGMVKTVFDAKTGELLGAHMIGAEVTEMIQGYVIARTLESTEQELMHSVFPHPTVSETMHEAVLDAWGQAIHF